VTFHGACRIFAHTQATVLDCANGYQKENQEEVDEVEEDCLREGDAAKEAGAEEENTQEIVEEEGRSEQSLGKKEGLEENDQREDREGD
jgi:hypothetical protein